ncbi:MAG: hypothetical protein A2020_04980 [Lentisphaerae bacterium GWF2_45_14]|nr:MAG: hypothetical protein A2020_04980 [Lentisphaerae bacterium GWF2_45_14]
MMVQEGNFTWVVPDGWLPPEGGEGDLINHESLMIMNTGAEQANLVIDIYFDDRPPVKGLAQIVEAERIKAIRLDKPEELGFRIPHATQYALRIRSNVKVIVQYGRMDVRQSNLAYYGTMAYPVN